MGAALLFLVSVSSEPTEFPGSGWGRNSVFREEGGTWHSFIYQGGGQPTKSWLTELTHPRGEGGFMHRHHVGFPSTRKDCCCEWSRTIENDGSADRLIDRDVMLTNRPRKNLQAPLLYKGSKPESFLFNLSRPLPETWFFYDPLTAGSLNQSCSNLNGIGPNFGVSIRLQ